MKKWLCVLVMLLLCFVACKKVQAENLIDPSLGWTPQFSFPFDTGVDAFWFPDTGQFAMGMSVTGARMRIPAITFATLDLNGLMATELGKNEGVVESPLYGIGLKGSVNILKINVTDDLKLLPSLGAGYLNNLKEVDNLSDFIDNFRFTVYGTLVQYIF